MNELINILRSHMTGSRETADRICNNEFELLGCSIKFGKHVDWTYGAGRDVKLPWELSRFQFLPTLCRAYEIHNDQKYALHAKELIRDWILKNPAGRSINWQIAMEAAIRACNFALAWFFLRESQLWRDEHFQQIFLKSLAEHGKFIETHLEYNRGFNTNHLIADFTGLFWLGTLFQDLPDAKRWQNISRQGLEDEMKNQVYEDGVDYEASISYHRLVAEFFGYSALLGKFNGVEFSPAFLARLEKMFEFAWHYTKPNGLAPQIGDNDDGRLFIFEDFYSWDRRDHRHLFWLANALFLENKKFVQSWGAGGIYIMRKDDFYCIVDCGQNGQNGNAGHAHNDTLSFELAFGGEDFIIDPGAFVYTGDRKARKRFRGTRMHNTVMIDEEEMNRFRLFRLFSMKNDAIPTVNKWESMETHDFLDAEHNGYERLRNPVIHRRTFKFDKKNRSLEIKDFFIGKGTHTLQWNFHFAPDIMVRQAHHDRMITEKNGKKMEMRLPKELTPYAVIRNDFVSPSYGIKEKATVLTFKKTFLLPHDTSFTFQPTNF